MFYMTTESADNYMHKQSPGQNLLTESHCSSKNKIKMVP